MPTLAPTVSPTLAPAQPQAPRRPVRCWPINRNPRDYVANYESLSNTCASIAFRQPGAARRFADYITNVQRTMSQDNNRRYSRYNIQLSTNNSISAEEKQRRVAVERPIVEGAIANYSRIANEYQERARLLLASLDPTPNMQDCQRITQSAFISQMSDANGLIALPARVCEQFNSVFAAFEKAYDGAYTKIGAQLPS